MRAPPPRWGPPESPFSLRPLSSRAAKGSRGTSPHSSFWALLQLDVPEALAGALLFAMVAIVGAASVRYRARPLP